MVDKQKALELRKTGMKYEELAKVLGCSVIWCKKNLKGEYKNGRFDNFFSNLLEVCKNAGRITYGDIKKCLSEDYPEVIQNEKNMRKFTIKLNEKLEIKNRKERIKTLAKQDVYITYIVTLNSELIYVGSGTEGRELHTISGCSHIYELNKLHFQKVKVQVEIVGVFKTRVEALELEQSYISKFQPSLNKKNSIQYGDNTVYARLRNGVYC